MKVLITKKSHFNRNGFLFISSDNPK